MSDLARVRAVEHLGARSLRITFSNGLVRELDFAEASPEMLASIDDDASFAAVTVDPVAGIISWRNGVDLDPDVLHGDNEAPASMQPSLLREYRMQQTG